MNAVELSQAIKSVHVFLVTLLIFLNNQSFWTRYVRDVLFQESINQACMATLPMSMLILAITRLRVCLCKGRATVLISRRSAAITYLIGIIIAITCCLMLDVGRIVAGHKWKGVENVTHSYLSNSTHDKYCSYFVYYERSSIIACEVLHVGILFIVPMVLGIMMYLKLCAHVHKSSTRVRARVVLSEISETLDFTQSDGNSSQRSNNRSRTATVIQTTLLRMLVIILLCWTPFLTIKIYILKLQDYCEKYNVMLLYITQAIAILSPFEEGLLQKEKRERVFAFYKSVMNRNKTTPNKSFIQEAIISSIPPYPRIILSKVQENRRKSSTEKLYVNNSRSGTPMCDEMNTIDEQSNCSETCLRRFSQITMSSTSEILAKSELLMSSLQLSTDTELSDTPVFIISTSRTLDQNSLQPAKKNRYSTKFVKRNESLMINPGTGYSQDINDKAICSPMSLISHGTVSTSSTISCDSHLFSNMCRSKFRKRSVLIPFSRKSLSSGKYSV